MTSKMKWLLIPSIGLIISLSLYVFLLGNIWAVAIAPFIGLSGGMLGYGLVNKIQLFDNFFNWMNKDKQS